MSCFKVGDRHPREIGKGIPIPNGIPDIGISKDVLVFFRPSTTHYGKFGFDWLRVQDSFLPRRSDTFHRYNMGYNYNAQGTKEAIPSKMKHFQPKPEMHKKYESYISQLLSTRVRNIELEGKNEEERLDYRMSVLTLMPYDSTLNPEELNLVAVLDSIVKTGARKPAYLKIGFCSATPDEAIAAKALKVNTIDLPTHSSKSSITIHSIGILKKDVTLYVYTNQCTRPVGAIKILANHKIKKIQAMYVSVTTNLNRNKKTNKPPEDTNIVRECKEMLAQALIRVDIFGGYELDMRDEFYAPTKKNHGTVKKPFYILDFDIHTKSSILSRLDDVLLANTQTDPYYSQLTKGGKSFPTDLYRLYFIDEFVYSDIYQSEISGGGTVGGNAAFFVKGKKVIKAETLAHELGHNLNLSHTFAYPKQQRYPVPYSFKVYTTDNIMDYSKFSKDKRSTFYHWQWKIMNKNIR